MPNWARTVSSCAPSASSLRPAGAGALADSARSELNPKMAWWIWLNVGLGAVPWKNCARAGVAGQRASWLLVENTSEISPSTMGEVP